MSLFNRYLLSFIPNCFDQKMSFILPLTNSKVLYPVLSELFYPDFNVLTSLWRNSYGGKNSPIMHVEHTLVNVFFLNFTA